MKYRVAFLFLLFAWSAQSQEQISLSLSGVDSLFLKNNLLLLAQQYDIQAQEAQIIQARAYPNPTFTADFNAIDPQHNETFHVGKTGEKAFSIQQVILMGGKRKTEIDIARQNTTLAQLEFDDLLRNLQLQLHSNFFTLHQQIVVLEKYDRQLRLLDTLITAYDAQAKKGNLPLKDVIRLKSVYLKINTERSELYVDHYDTQRQIQMLLRSDVYITPLLTDELFEGFNKTQDYNELKNLALQNRPDLKISQEQMKLAELNITLQRRMAIPDIQLNGSYDQRGGAFINQTNAGFTMPLPTWNLNRGNIRSAKAAGQATQLYQQLKKIEVETDIQAAWRNMNLSITEYNKVKKYYSEDFETVFRGVNYNFQKRNMSILEFVDFFESYNESLSEYERVKNHLALSAAQINYVTAAKVY